MLDERVLRKGVREKKNNYGKGDEETKEKRGNEGRRGRELGKIGNKRKKQIMGEKRTSKSTGNRKRMREREITERPKKDEKMGIR